jgi:hypothetical protein
MPPKTSPVPRADSPDPGADWPARLDRDRDHATLSRLGLIADRETDPDPRDGLTELALGGDSPDLPGGARGLDENWATRRIL